MYSNRVATKPENGYLEVEAEVPYLSLQLCVVQVVQVLNFTKAKPKPELGHSKLDNEVNRKKKLFLPFSISLCLGVLLSA